ncbi:MAG: ATP-binding protein [Ignavibacteriaceae bacterium]
MKQLTNLSRLKTLKSKKQKLEEKELAVKSRTENLSAIRNFVSSGALEIGVPLDVVENIILAVDEACTNIIKHAYQYFPEGEIIVKLKISPEKFTVIIIDHGVPFKPGTIPDPDLQKYYRQHRVGGLGMYLMKSLMDEVKYVSVPGKYNRVLLSKNLSTTH